MPAKKTKSNEHPDTSSPNQVLSAKERHAEAQARYRARSRRAYIKSSEELSRQAAETHWGIDKEYCEIKHMRWAIITIILQVAQDYSEHIANDMAWLPSQIATSLPKKKLGRAAAFLQLVPNSQRLENQKSRTQM
ncbi:hypothetical protein DFH08DRAFT_812941 [Mycena albidolilacea]|uniref:Uncharacterized protein n=1 Tax=Mycena albidolilacea TaxID=1033008 RepID=A0AAD6ZTB6_9AGAR|nr:hypothetical protein DFH08DRAFT_812941 [Mycena albidolilacea]